MPVYDTFTKRKRTAAKAGRPEVYVYDQMPAPLRVQIAHIWMDAIGGYRQMQRFDFDSPPPSNRRWQAIQAVVARERGVFTLSEPTHNPFEQCTHALLNGTPDEALEIVEISFRIIESLQDLHPYQREQEGLKQDPDDAIDELNRRFKEHGIGYRYEDRVLVRIDSELVHAEVTLPALELLHTEGFDGALQEFMSAHGHYCQWPSRSPHLWPSRSPHPRPSTTPRSERSS